MPAIQSFEDFEAAALEICRPKLKSRFGALAWEDLDQPGPEHEYLIDDFLTIGDKSIIGGPSRSGKSFLAIDAGMSIARGVPFFQRDTVQGLVIYQAGEGARGVKKRLRAYRKHHNISSGTRVPFVLLQSKIDLYSADGDTTPLIEECKAIADMYDVPLRALFIDTLATATAGADENSGKDMGAVMANIDRIVQALPGTHVALVHHLNAAGTKLRGHSSIFANIDQVIIVTRDEETNIRTATLDKQKDDEDGVRIRFRLRKVEIGVRPNGKPLTSCVVQPLGGEADIKPGGEKKDQGVRLNADENIVFRALLQALQAHGERPAGHASIPETSIAVRASHWKAAYQAIDPAASDDDDEKTITDRVNKALKSGGAKLMQYGVIKRDNPFVWLTGKPVRGFERAVAAFELPRPPLSGGDTSWADGLDQEINGSDL
ncbi:AAA family ATPase [Rhodopseudomonas faecalis]|nr:AAA family ATPase [Rhodopseudomonas faecalis]